MGSGTDKSKARVLHVIIMWRSTRAYHVINRQILIRTSFGRDLFLMALIMYSEIRDCALRLIYCQ